jgi:hypothetical protein
MIERFKSLVKSVGILETIKYIGGFDLFKDLVGTNPSLKVYFNMLKASCSVSFDGYPDDGEDDDYYFGVVNGYRDEFIYLTHKYFAEKYVNKMGYELEMDFA